MLVQILDVDYFLNGNKPVVRIFGKKENGQTVCGLVDNFFPYFYVDATPAAIDKIEEMQGDPKLGMRYEVVEKTPAIGYSTNTRKFAKVFLYSPQDVPKVRELLAPFGRCYEADILFKYRFMIDNGLKGMQWVDMEGEPTKTSTTKVQSYRVKSLKPADVKKNAELRHMCFDIECLPLDYNREMDPKLDPVIAIAVSFIPAYKGNSSLVLVAKKSIGPGVRPFTGEKEMLQGFLDIINDYDPDIITGFNINGFDFLHMQERFRKFNIPMNFGRADKPMMLKKFAGSNESEATGRVVADVYQLVKRDVNLRFVRYNLDTISREMLGEEKGDVKHTEMQKVWATDVPRLIEYARKDAVLAMRLLVEKRLLDKFVEIAKVSGTLLQDTLRGQSIRIETLVLHEFRKRNMLMPPKPSDSEMEQRKTEIKGATVLEPKKGVHQDSVLVLDFQSLYPSIIRTFNVSPDTLVLGDTSAASHESPNGARFVDKSAYVGFLPTILEDLLSTRKRVKAEMKSAKGDEKRTLDAKQHALKILANSIYGYTGYARARLYVADVANAITAYGRSNIEKTRKFIEEKFPDLDVVYGDTDSVFIKANEPDLEKAWELGTKISQLATQQTGLQLEFEKVYRTFLILTKKRYAGWKFVKSGDGWEDSIDMKGIETVRRDWCSLVSELTSEILVTILKERDVQKASERVKEVFKKLSSGNIAMEKLTIVKGLQKPIDSYDGMLPHIELAKKLRSRDPANAPKVGERLGFVIIRGTSPLSKRAEDPEWAKRQNLQIDVDYYTNNQLLPPIERILGAAGVEREELLRAVTQQSALAFFTQPGIVCEACGRSHRRAPLKGACDCGASFVKTPIAAR